MNLRLRRRIWIVIYLIGVLGVASACNMPALTSDISEDASEQTWEWVGFFKGFFTQLLAGNPANSTPPLSNANPPPGNPEDESYFTWKYGGDFSCIEEYGYIFGFFNDFPTEPTAAENSLVERTYMFSLRRNPDGLNFVKYYMTWDFNIHTLSPIKKITSDGTIELLKYSDLVCEEEGIGDGIINEEDLFEGYLEMHSMCTRDGKPDGERDYEYDLAGFYDPNNKKMKLCLDWNPFSEDSKQEILSAGVAGIDIWCIERKLNYYVCTPATFIP